MKKTKKKNNEFLLKIKSFFNKPAPIIIFLVLLVCFMLIYITSYVKKTNIYVGKLSSEKVSVASVHIFTNGDMNYYYADPAYYEGKEEIYSFQMGYYVVDEKGNYIEFATRSNSLNNPKKLSEVIKERSGWDFAEAASQDYFFSKEVKENLNNLHFVIKASTKKDLQTADIMIDEKVELEKITK